ncbi:hypothetical protein D9619_005295 [Psilocybe cf. subviscida]|uniref:Uncharacterized protein n=1 Tax=Psilocybe cf. subviscida TaxID=2480587 RepID=A0A8H5BVK5_9AGAR|nr:hypothetical protein D9619_005295 [Psilocybe cf. subviscida]
MPLTLYAPVATPSDFSVLDVQPSSYDQPPPSSSTTRPSSLDGSNDDSSGLDEGDPHPTRSNITLIADIVSGLGILSSFCFPVSSGGGGRGRRINQILRILLLHLPSSRTSDLKMGTNKVG